MAKSIKTPAKQELSGKNGKKSVLPYIVGIGASAGGLEALLDFFSYMPISNNIAFVVVQHLHPNHKDMLPELLQRVTPLKVLQVQNKMQAEANHVYVIPPNKDLTIADNSFIVRDPVVKRGLRLPIDLFFRSLAEDQKEYAIGIILSGMGSDGTLGAKSIKEKSGLILVQSPRNAKFDAMPQSVIDAGLADIIAPANELAEQIFNYLKSSALDSNKDMEHRQNLKSLSAINQIMLLLRKKTSNDFSLYKTNTLFRRIERRINVNNIQSITGYVQYLRENPQELEILFKELLIGVTNFFRDPEVWQEIKKKVLPDLIAQYPKGKEFRAWVPACSTGEEAYTLAILFREFLDEMNPAQHYTLQIFATDIDEDAIAIARKGCYQTTIEKDLSQQQLSTYFTRQDKRYQVSKKIREMVIFATQNIIMEPPFTNLNILTCRNLLIYLSTPLQKKLIPLFHYALTNHGFLVLGNAETTDGFENLFSSYDKKSHIYCRVNNNIPLPDKTFSYKIFPVISCAETEPLKEEKMSDSTYNLKTLADQILLENYTPAAILTSKDGDILYINGRTGKYLEPASGKANWNIYAMAREGLGDEIGFAIKRALEQEKIIHVNDLSVGLNGGTQIINLTVQKVLSPKELKDKVLIVFHEVAKLVKSSKRKPVSNQKQISLELEQAKAQMQAMKEKMQYSQEELKATNEELQSTNEELQSTNEELTTSKEEMQSLNEELQTVNAELQSKVKDLSWVNNDMENLLNSTEIATIFLDNKLKIRRFTSHISQLFKVITSDIGRPLSDIVTDLHYDKLHSDAHEVLRTLIFTEKQVTAKNNRWFKVRIMPYRTHENVIDGVVITFTDITDFKNLEESLRNIREPND